VVLLDLKEWKNRIKGMRRKTVHYSYSSLTVSKLGGGLHWIVSIRKRCECCGALSSRSVSVVFHKPLDSLTVFQSHLLFFVFVLGCLPHDYAKYHNCIAGKEFIKNIKSVEVLR